MADLLRPEHVRELISYGGGPCVSVFLPTHRVTPDSGQDPIRLRNLLDEAENRLAAAGLRAPAVREVLRPGRDLLGPGRFWSYQSDGLAVFLAPGWSRVFRLPEEFGELVVVAGRFHVKPLPALLAAGHRFYVLALSQNQVRLLEETPHDVQEAELADAPRSLGDALKYDDLEKELGLHVAGRGGPGARVVFHGHGAGGEVDKALLERFLRQVDDGLQQVLRTETGPGAGAAVRPARHPVTIVEALGRLAPFDEPEVSAAIESVLNSEAVGVVTGATVTGVRRDGRSRSVLLKTAAGAERELACGWLLVAAGRRPVCADLNLSAVGVRADGLGEVVTYTRQRTDNPRIWPAILIDVRGLRSPAVGEPQVRDMLLYPVSPMRNY